ncbi:NAD-dependent epimerase/dehydratase family protein [Nitrospinae bacterium AH_259_B05_G02_I21]|nr:NAD-dependent epimerase/dehydratase family protein [Nitrospinae bacterium AH_259_B05_G02_I21]
MASTILVTGGAGFIGSHLVDGLLERGEAVRVLDILDPQVHPSGSLPSYIQGHVDTGRVELHVGDVRDRPTWRKALDGVRVVVHLAAAVGVGQSMYEVARYVEINTQGTAILLDILANEAHRVEKLIVASSMSIYGEGSSTCPECGPFVPEIREEKQLQKGDYEVHCPSCGSLANPAPTPETKPPVPTSVYAVSKRDQEELCLTIGRAYDIPTVALRYFNVYGPRQALTNPYAGVAAIFSSRLLNNNSPLIFEDGDQTRDFIHISDIVQANLLAMDCSEAAGQALNIGTGRPTSVAQLAGHIAQALGSDIAPTVVGKYRSGDIRHCVADISRAREVLGFEPRVPLANGVSDLVDWVRQQEAEDRVDIAARELEQKGLTR